MSLDENYETRSHADAYYDPKSNDPRLNDACRFAAYYLLIWLSLFDIKGPDDAKELRGIWLSGSLDFAY